MDNSSGIEGSTADQLRDAPRGALYIWVSSDTHYVESLAKSLGRDDIEIRGPGWLRMENVAGRRGATVVLDHAFFEIVWLNDNQREALSYLMGWR